VASGQVERQQRRRDDAFAVDGVVAVQVGPGAGLAELVDAERDDPGPEGAAQEAERVRGAVLHGEAVAAGVCNAHTGCKELLGFCLR